MFVLLPGAVKDSVVGEERVARYLLTMLSTRSAHLRWRADFEVIYQPYKRSYFGVSLWCGLCLFLLTFRKQRVVELTEVLD